MLKSSALSASTSAILMPGLFALSTSTFMFVVCMLGLSALLIFASISTELVPKISASSISIIPVPR